MPEKNAKRKNNDSDIKIIFIKALVFSMVIYFTLFVIFSFVSLATDLNESIDYLVCLVCFIMSSFFSGLFAGFNMKKDGLLYGILFSMPMNFTVILLSLYLNKFSVTPIIFVSSFTLLLASGIGGIISVNQRYRRRG